MKTKKTKFNTLAVVGCQYGDESKGAVVDSYAQGWANIVVRSQGGNNAGHTVVKKNGHRYALRALPSGILTKGVMNIIAHGCVINLEQLCDEIDTLRREGVLITKDNLMISNRCHIIMPYHKQLDSDIEENRVSKIKTTGNGIGPCYADKMYRLGIRLADIAGKPDVLTAMIHDAIVAHDIEVGDPTEIDRISLDTFRCFLSIQDFIGDTELYLNDAIEQKKKILFEGAQAAMLDIDNGTYPYVTSSNTTTAGMATGSGVAPKYFNDVVGVVKAYTTRVGNGPFVTELANEELTNIIRNKAHEFGTVTGRPRRIGWLDLVQLKKAIRVNGVSEIALRLVDVLSGVGNIKVCTKYNSNLYGFNLENVNVPADVSSFENIVPEFAVLDGWTEDISQCKTYDELPENCKKYIEFVERELGVPVTMIGVGPAETQTIYR